jgi:hypothetical protein
LAARAVVHVPDDRRDDARNERGDEDVADDRIALEKRGLLYAVVLLDTVLRPSFWLGMRIPVVMRRIAASIFSMLVSHSATLTYVNRTVS